MMPVCLAVAIHPLATTNAVLNTLATIAFAHTPLSAVSPFFLAGMLVVAAGAATVLAFGPRAHAPAKPA
jgi:hypothetical protein